MERIKLQNIYQLIAQAEEELKSYRNRSKRILEKVRSENRDNLTSDETKEFDSYCEKAETIKDRLTQLREIRDEDEESDRHSRITHKTDASRSSSATQEIRASGATASQLYGAPVATGPVWRDSNGRPAALERGQSWADHASVREYADRNRDRDNMAEATYGGLPQLIRSLSTTGASAVVPSGYSAKVFDLMRNKSALLRANPTILPMAHKTEYYGRLTADVTNVAFRAEGDTITAGDPTFDQVTLTAKTISGLCVMSLEWAQDSINGNELVENSIAQALAMKVDEIAIYGGLVTGSNNEGKNYSNPPNPSGLIKMLEVQASGNILGAAANGTAITAATPWNEVLDTHYQVELGNATPNALLWNVKMAKKLAKTYTSTYEQLPLPREIAGLNRIASNQIVSYTQGTMANIATDLFIGDFSEFLYGQRMDLELRVLDQRYAETGSIAVLAVMRVDFALAHPAAFAMYRALGGA